MTEETRHLLERIGLKGMLEHLDLELEQAQQEGPSYEDFLRRLLRHEAVHAQMRSLEYRIRTAGLPERWSIDTFPFASQPGVRPAVIRQLASLEFVAAKANIVFIGPTGVGKTGLATGLLCKALENGHRGIFVKAQDLFDDMYASLADHSTRALVRRLARFDVLVIDEMGYLNLRPEQSNIFFKLMEERYNRHSTIITTNLDYPDWAKFLGQAPMVAALLDRLRHKCTTIRIDGPSLRSPTT